MRSVLALALTGASLACSNPPVSARQDGYADVLGSVTQASGVPLSNTTVVISCGEGAAARTVAADSLGRFGASLAVPGAAGHNVLCRFGAPDLARPVSRADVSLSFAPPGLHALQFVTLTGSQP